MSAGRERIQTEDVCGPIVSAKAIYSGSKSLPASDAIFSLHQQTGIDKGMHNLSTGSCCSVGIERASTLCEKEVTGREWDALFSFFRKYTLWPHTNHSDFVFQNRINGTLKREKREDTLNSFYRIH